MPYVYTHIWPEIIYPLKDLIDSVADELSIDKTRIHLTGISMGGYGTWSMGIAFPDYFASLAPICGGGVSWATGCLTDVPIWAFHGDKDSVVPVRNSIEMVDAIASRNGKAKLTLFHNVDHDSWDPAFRETRLIEWMLSQKRG